MDGEEEVSHMSDDLDSDFNSIIEMKKREAKGRCLRIEGEDGYVFRSYSLHSNRSSAPKKAPSQSTTLDTNSAKSLDLSQVKKAKASDSQDAIIDNIKVENYENGNEEILQNKNNCDELNGIEDIPDDGSLAFGTSVDGPDASSPTSFTNSLTSPLIPLSPSSPKNGDLTNDVITSASKITSLSSSEVKSCQTVAKNGFLGPQKVQALVVGLLYGNISICHLQTVPKQFAFIA
ncbi:hypothetical protein WMY93_021485 [Mugilogobius chulae]|uniref:Uncharacterized protein n=1 Tax=Mugilogobius chulae TaxID=88201 RepID=A0AAW0NCA6_9GOBI